MSRSYCINLKTMPIIEQLIQVVCFKSKIYNKISIRKTEAYCTCFFQPYLLIFPLFGIESQPSILDSGRKKKYSIQL